ncbi:MAG: hypothetical protein Q9226_005901, partial [Calogaya cf. arnoldii]
MDHDVIAAIAALVVAFVAFLVASAQAIQQYLVSGQLIRLCDSVVYNQMPGQGHRIWQYSQFRFRVVYSIPQIHLLPDLWLDISSHVRPLPPDAAPLPNLKVQKSKSTSAALAGEASWVSFVRAVQHSAGRSMRYVMVDGDADRCPSDLPVVPMQLSMRDIAVMALSAGMQVTDVSFQSQSISIQGDAGTITCSRHPVLGTLIHFAQKQALENHGIQVQGGTIQGNWVARMLNVVTVAGHRYDSVDRKHYEEDEGSWMEASKKIRILVDHKPASTSNDPPPSFVRRRRPTQSTTAEMDHGASMTDNHDRNPSIKPLQSPEKDDPLIIDRPQDGKWALVSGPAHPVAGDSHALVPPRSVRPPLRGSVVQSSDTLKTIQYHIRRARRKPTPRNAEPILPTSEPIDSQENDASHNSQPEVTNITPVTYELKSDSLAPHSNVDHYPAAGPGEVDKTQQGHLVAPQPENGNEQGLSQDPNRQHPNKQLVKSRTPLLLTNGTASTGPRSALPQGSISPNLDRELLQDQARQEFVVDKWQQTFQQRRKERSRGRSRNNQDERAASSLGTTRASERQDRPTIAPKTKRGEPMRHEMLVTKRRRGTSSPQSSDDDSSVLVGHCWTVKDNKSSLPGYYRDRPLSKSKSRKSRYRWNTSHSSSLSISPAPGSYERPEPTHSGVRKTATGDVYRKAPYQGHRTPASRGRGRNSEISTVAIAFDEKGPSRPDSTTRIYSSQGYPVEHEYPVSDTSVERGRKRVRVLDPPRNNGALVLRKSSPSSPSQKAQPSKPALRSPTERFPNYPDFVRPGVGDRHIPKNARWTKISRNLIDPKVLDLGRERYVEEEAHVIVLRVLSRSEIQQYAAETHELRVRPQFPALYGDEDLGSDYQVSEGSSEGSDGSHASFTRPRGSEDEMLGTAIHAREWQTTGSQDPDGARKINTGQSPKKATPQGSAKRYSREHEVKQLKVRLQQNSFSSTDLDDVESTLDQEGSPQRARSQDIEQPFLFNRVGRAPSSVTGRRRGSISRHQSLENEDVLTYAEEIMFIHFDHILKRLTICTEQCKDVITTLQSVQTIQPELGPNVPEIYGMIKDTNTSVKELLFHIEPLRANKKVANIVNSKLDKLLLGLQKALDAIQARFDLFDVTSLTPDDRQAAWQGTLDWFQKQYDISIGEYISIVRSFSTEIASNFQAGIYTSPEADLLMKRLSEANSHRRASSKPAYIPEDPRQLHSSRSRSRYFHSPSRFTDSPRVSPIDQTFHRPSFCDEVPKHSSRRPPHRNAIQYRRYPTDTSSSYSTSDTDDSFSSKTDTSSLTLASSKSSYTGEMKWFWISQADVLPGYFATPWKDLFSSAECVGTISVLLKSLEMFTNESNFQYVESQHDSISWLGQGKTTYPSYAHNAVGGVVVAGTYRATMFHSFKNPIAPLELLKCYDHQVDRNFSVSAQAVIHSTAELMGLDTWLSFSGRQSEIIHGPSSLLRTLPTLIQQIMTNFHLEFTRVDRTSKDGGSRIIKTSSDSLLEYLKEQGLSDAERLFCVVALLRTAK